MRIGYIGIGNLGRYMVASLLAAGHDVVIHDVREQVREDPLLAQAGWAASPMDVAQASECTITCLPGPDQVREVVLSPAGVLAGLKDGDLYIDMSTSTPQVAREIAAAADARGVLAIDAPVSGGPRGARLATLTIMVGGTQAAYNACLPVLKCMGDKIFFVGDPGTGHVAKLVNNMMGLVNGLAAMEAMVVGTKAGIDPEILLKVVSAGAGDSFVLNIIRYVVLKGTFDPAKFALSLATKDLRLAVAYADEIGVPVDIIRHGHEVLENAQGRGLGALDWSSYITLIEQAAGVTVRARPTSEDAL